MHQGNIIALAVFAILLSACNSPAAPTPRVAAPTQVVLPVDTNTPIPPTPTPTPLTVCAKENLRIRAEPNTHSDILGALTAGECANASAISPDAGWVAISGEGPSGWASLKYLSVEGLAEQLPVAGDLPTRMEMVTIPTATRKPAPTVPPPPVLPSPTAKPAVPMMLSCSATGSKVGEYVTCKIPRAYCSYQPGVGGSPTFCNDARYPGHSFTLVAWGIDWSHYDGECLVISGLVTQYKGKPQIEAGGGTQVGLCQ